MATKKILFWETGAITLVQDSIGLTNAVVAGEDWLCSTSGID